MKREASWTSPKFYQTKREKDAIRQQIEEELEDRELLLERRAEKEDQTAPFGMGLPPLRDAEPGVPS
jgi:hypothetical protein